MVDVRASSGTPPPRKSVEPIALYSDCASLASISTLAQDLTMSYPKDPKCYRLTLTGQIVEVGQEEVDFAKEALFFRHPVMKKWPLGYKWTFMKLFVDQVWLQDWVGELSLVPLDEYCRTTLY